MPLDWLKSGQLIQDTCINRVGFSSSCFRRGKNFQLFSYARFPLLCASSPLSSIHVVGILVSR